MNFTGRYFVIGCGSLQTETMAVFPSGVDTETVSGMVQNQTHNDVVISTGKIEINVVGPLDRRGDLSIQCYPDDNNARKDIDTKLAKKTFGP